MDLAEPVEVDSAERIARFTEESWRERYVSSSIYMRYYVLPVEPGNDFEIPGYHGNEVTFADIPFKVTVAHITEKSYSTIVSWVVKQKSDGQVVTVENLHRILPTAIYVVISTPMRDELERSTAHRAAAISVDELVGMMRAFGGNNLFRQQAYECIVDLDDGFNEVVLSSVAPVIQPFDGPFTTSDVWQDFNEIVEALTSCDADLRRRIARVAQLIEHGANAELGLKYYSYWVALEVAADTHSSGKIVTLLRHAYGEKDNASVQNLLGLTLLKDLRTAIFHHGMPYEMSADVERYFQLCLLDVIRAKLGLQCKRYMQGGIDAGFDLRSLQSRANPVINVSIQSMRAEGGS